MNNTITFLRNEVKIIASKERAAVSRRFFKTGKGQYGEGDVFVGITVPQCRSLAKKYNICTLEELETLLQSKIHEERLIVLLILVEQFDIASDPMKKQIYDFYLKNTFYINNWDLVDLSADKIVGSYLLDKPKNILVELATSENIWRRRIAMLATYNFIKNKSYTDALNIAKILLHDKHDLIQKAVGWMLREIGKRDEATEKKFLDKYHREMPRTTLRYAIERFPSDVRKKYMLRQPK